ncbi:LOW QUALITY PROTEIN: uncharacterized protein LOC119604321 [Lucilia sericata]|uniref:LOW QUALITY PROTEIN: uncharacterized protein LOC119604321 n=1 Tax=Lucilia sericata TaxID=13632 RepID=UPI0018A8797C|nr:LOW QUALITY PROTEIN: uncharacterized protein LOC119604321 [Lucilia sericata]
MNNFTLERNTYRRKLIMLVKQHPILWNKTQENYNRNRPQKIMAWHQISEQLDISVDRLRRTWENLRDQYRRDLKREVRYGFKSKWRFFSDMDFIRDMVSCKEHEFKENEFTDSDSELDVTDNQNHGVQTQCSPISTTLVAPTTTQTITTPTNSTISNNTSSPTNVLPFQPIMLSKQWQVSVPQPEEMPQIYNPTPVAIYTTHNAPPAPATLEPINYQTNCDSSKDCQQPNNESSLNYETVAKQEPDLDLELDNNPPAIEIQDTTPEKSNESSNAREFQEPSVSTSCHKRSRLSVEEISDTPLASTSRSQIKTETDLNAKDDDYYFVMSLLPSLRQIPRNRKFPLRIGIMSLIAKDLEEVCKE